MSCDRCTNVNLIARGLHRGISTRSAFIKTVGTVLHTFYLDNVIWLTYAPLPSVSIGPAASERWSPAGRHLCTSQLYSTSSPHQKSIQNEQPTLGTQLTLTFFVHVLLSCCMCTCSLLHRPLMGLHACMRKETELYRVVAAAIFL